MGGDNFSFLLILLLLHRELPNPVSQRGAPTNDLV